MLSKLSVNFIKNTKKQTVNVGINFSGSGVVTYHFPDAAVAQVQSVMQQLVRYKAHTATFLGQPITTFCGLSCYVPTSANAWVHPYYSSLDWAQQSSFYTLISDQ